ncbi:MAG: hypothetical protein ABI896_02790 [Actinomycetota bacterium]
MKALVVDVGWVNGLAAIRSLGRAGISVLALDHRAGALGFRSRYATPVTIPDPVVDEEGFVARVAEIEGSAVVFPTHDPPLNALARNRERLPDLLFPFPAWSSLEAIQDKRHQLESAVAAGVDIPQTSYPAGAAEARAAAEEIGVPVLVKPQHPDGFKRRFAKQAFRCATPAEVEQAYADAEPFGPMVQELVPGGDDELYTLGSYLREDGKPLGLFSGRKLKQVPPGIGTCRTGEAVWVQEVVDAGLRFLRELGFHGLSQVEFKRDPRDGRFKLMEINPRLWQWHALASACGVDLPVLAYRDLAGEKVEPVLTHDSGRIWTISLMPGELPVFARPPFTEAVFASDDVKPGLVHAARVARGVFR